MNNKGKKVLTIIAGSTVTFFSLCSCVIAAIAWFSFAHQAQAEGETFKVITSGDGGAEIKEINLIKFNYNIETIGTGENAFTITDYFRPVNGSVDKYLYDEVAFNKQYNQYIQDGETGEWAWTFNTINPGVSMMNLYDPVDLVVMNERLIDLNCNAVFEVCVASASFTGSCYLQLDGIFDPKTISQGEISLTDCADFDVYSPEDLSNSNPLFKEDAWSITKSSATVFIGSENPESHTFGVNETVEQYDVYRKNDTYYVCVDVTHLDTAASWKVMTSAAGNPNSDDIAGSLDDYYLDTTNGANDVYVCGGNYHRYHKYYPSYKNKANSLITGANNEYDWEDIYYKVSYLSSLENSHAHFYGTDQKGTISISKNKLVDFNGSDVLKLYVNVNYSVSQLEDYFYKVYSGNTVAVFDYCLNFNFTNERVS